MVLGAKGPGSKRSWEQKVLGVKDPGSKKSGAKSRGVKDPGVKECQPITRYIIPYLVMDQLLQYRLEIWRNFFKKLSFLNGLVKFLH